MAIILRLDRVLADRKMQLGELADRIGINIVNLSNIKTGKVKAIRFSILNAICRELNCQPGDIMEFKGMLEGGNRIQKKFLLVIIFSCILGSAVVSSMESLSYTFKSIFYGISMTVLLIIGAVGLFKYFTSGKEGGI